MHTAIDHLLSASLTSLDVRVILYGLGRGLLWIVVISACWSMYGYFRQFYANARARLGIEKKEKAASVPVVSK
jgi:hypothetical protein